MKKPHRHLSYRQSGYVLLMTLLLVMIVSLLTASTARLSIGRASAALDAQRRLQCRWATHSIEQSVLARAEEILREHERVLLRPVASCGYQLRLGDEEFELLICDEQSKANPGFLVQRLGYQTALSRLQQLLSDRVAGGRIRLPHSVETIDGLPQIGNYSQFIANVDGTDLLKDVGMDGVFDRVTCWGDGRLNILRAAPHAIETSLATELDLSARYRLLELRATFPQPKLGKLLDQLDLSREKRNALEFLVTNESHAHSVWIIHRSPPVKRHLIVDSMGTQTFEW